MTNLNKKFENIQELVQRPFDLDETMQLLQLNKTIFWSWGVEGFLKHSDTGLLLKVNGHHHKGWVLIILAWNDTYSYYLLQDNNTIKSERHEVYFDVLVEMIDKDVEYISDYK